MHAGIRGVRDGDEIERLTRFEPLTGHKLPDLPDVTIFPGKQFATPDAKMKPALISIRGELGGLRPPSCLIAFQNRSRWSPTSSRQHSSMIR